MKLAIDRKTCKGQVVADADERTHRVVSVKFSHRDSLGGAHYIDVWGGTWRVANGETVCTVGEMDKWA